MFWLPRPRTSWPSRKSSSLVLVAEASAPIEAAPCCDLMFFRPLATYSSATVQSTFFHWPPCLTIGWVRRASLFRAS